MNFKLLTLDVSSSHGLMNYYSELKTLYWVIIIALGKDRLVSYKIKNNTNQIRKHLSNPHLNPHLIASP